MKSMNDSTVRELILDRTVLVEMEFGDTNWPHLMVEGKVDTGADGCSIDESLANHLGWKRSGFKTVKSSLGKETRDIVKGVVTIRGIRFHLRATVSDRGNLSHPLLIGHWVLKDLLNLEEE